MNVQGKSIDVITTPNNANMTVQSLKKCRSDQHHQNLWDLVMNISDKVKSWVTESSFVDFLEASVPRPRKIPRKLQALVREEGSKAATFSPAFESYKVNVYFSSFDFVTNEQESRFPAMTRMYYVR